MRFIKSVLPNIAVALSLAVAVVAILGVFNPMMGFLQSTQGVVLILICCLVNIISALVSYLHKRKED